jgi:hypothetical protein
VERRETIQQAGRPRKVFLLICPETGKINQPLPKIVVVYFSPTTSALSILLVEILIKLLKFAVVIS